MKQRPRIYYTEEQKTLMWDRWQQGESLHARSPRDKIVCNDFKQP